MLACPREIIRDAAAQTRARNPRTSRGGSKLEIVQHLPQIRFDFATSRVGCGPRRVRGCTRAATRGSGRSRSATPGCSCRRPTLSRTPDHGLVSRHLTRGLTSRCRQRIQPPQGPSLARRNARVLPSAPEQPHVLEPREGAIERAVRGQRAPLSSCQLLGHLVAVEVSDPVALEVGSAATDLEFKRDEGAGFATHAGDYIQVSAYELARFARLLVWVGRVRRVRPECTKCHERITKLRYRPDRPNGSADHSWRSRGRCRGHERDRTAELHPLHRRTPRTLAPSQEVPPPLRHNAIECSRLTLQPLSRRSQMTKSRFTASCSALSNSKHMRGCWRRRTATSCERRGARCCRAWTTAPRSSRSPIRR